MVKQYFCKMFLNGMRNIVVLGFAVMILSSCGEYQKVLKGSEDNPKYELAVQLYEKGVNTGKEKYFKKSLRLQEQIINKYRGKPQGQKLSFLYADSYFQLRDYYTAGYQFERFAKAYPESDKTEEASFKSAKSYYEISPRYSLDQEYTKKGIFKLQSYLDSYPEGGFFDKANAMAQELQTKLEKKAYEIAKQYHHTLHYKAAVEAMDNFILDYPGSSFREKAYYYKFESAYLLAINSYKYLMEERLETAWGQYEKYIKYYPQGEFIEQATTYSEDIQTRLKEFKNKTT